MTTRAKLALILPVAGLAAGWLVSAIVTPRYLVTARLAAGNSLAPSINGREYLGQLEKDVLDSDVLSMVIEDPGVDIYRRERARLPLAQVVGTMRRNIVIETDSTGGSYIPFRLSFTYSDPLKA